MGEYSAQHRGGQGLINVQTTKRNGKVENVLDVRDEDEVMIMTELGMMIRSPIRAVSTIGRNTQGVRLIRLNEGDRVTSVAKVVEEEDDGTSGEGDEEGNAGAEMPDEAAEAEE